MLAVLVAVIGPLVVGFAAFLATPGLISLWYRATPLSAYVKPLEMIDYLEAPTETQKREGAIIAVLESGNFARPQHAIEAVEPELAEPVVTAGTSLQLSEDDMGRLVAFSEELQDFILEAQEAGDAKKVREALTVRSRLSESFAAAQGAVQEGELDEEVASLLMKNLELMEVRLCSLKGDKVEVAKKRLRAVNNYYLNEAEGTSSI